MGTYKYDGLALNGRAVNGKALTHVASVEAQSLGDVRTRTPASFGGLSKIGVPASGVLTVT